MRLNALKLNSTREIMGNYLMFINNYGMLL